MSVLRLIYVPLDRDRDRIVVDVMDRDQSKGRWVFHDGRWKRTQILAFVNTQVTVTDAASNQTWTFSHAEAQQAITAAQNLHGRVVQR